VVLFDLKGLKALQESGLCHRNLSLDALTLKGDHAIIDRLDWCMRFNKNAPVDEDKALPMPGGNNPQYVAPEYFGCLTGGWDGFAADLWASGLMLYSMVVSSEALFVAPLQEDKTFAELCVKGKIGDCVEKFAKSIGREIVLSDELVNLLQNMLRADPKQRYTLDEVMDHPWVKSEEIMAPSAWEQMKTQASSEMANAKE
jgi:serine/threonine protein kinase